MPTSPSRPSIDPRSWLLLAATLVTGLAAGFFYTYEASVVRGLAEVSDPTYVETFQAINDTIRNPIFGFVFFGALPALVVAAAVNWKPSSPLRRGLLVAAPLLYLCCMLITVTGNVPLNDDLAAVGIVVDDSAATGARAAFEDDWNDLNRLRTLAAAGSFAAVASVLVVPGARSVGQTD